VVGSEKELETRRVDAEAFSFGYLCLLCRGARKGRYDGGGHQNDFGAQNVGSGSLLSYRSFQPCRLLVLAVSDLCSTSRCLTMLTVCFVIVRSVFRRPVTLSCASTRLVALRPRYLTTEKPQAAPTEPLSTPASTPPPAPVAFKQSRWRRFLQTLGRVTLITIISSAGAFYYITQKDRHPGPQLPFDSEKKTVVILGSGWAASSLLKQLDTEDYNVVRILDLSQHAIHNRLCR
jgi:hypothetical protein